MAAKEVAANTEGINVDVDALLKNADKTSPRRNRHPAMPPPPPPPPPPLPPAAAGVGMHGGFPPGVAPPYYPQGLPAGFAAIPVAFVPMAGVGGPPPPGMGGGGGGGRRRRRRRR